MNNICEQINKTERQQPTLMDMMQVINRLTQELADANAENYILKNENELLHNMIKEKYEKASINGGGGWSEEETLLVAQAYAEAEKDYNF